MWHEKSYITHENDLLKYKRNSSIHYGKIIFQKVTIFFNISYQWKFNQKNYSRRVEFSKRNAE